MNENVIYSEICKYIQLLNNVRTQTVRLLSREMDNPLSMKKRCNDQINCDIQRQFDVLGQPEKITFNRQLYVEEYDSIATETDEDTSQTSLSDLNDELNLLSLPSKISQQTRPTFTEINKKDRSDGHNFKGGIGSLQDKETATFTAT